MRAIVTSLLILAAAPAAATPPSSANLLKLHPGPWRPPVALQAGMRFEIDSGDPAAVASSPDPLATFQARARAQAAASITVRSDGSRHAVVGTAFRSYTLATIDDQGRLTTDCVSSATEARARVDAAAKKRVRK